MRRTAILIPAILLGIVAAVLAVHLSTLTTKQILLGILIAGLVPLAAVTRQPKAILLAAWILSLTYFRVSFPIDSMAGFQGFYVTAADGVFLLVLGFWVYEALFYKRGMAAHGPPLLWFFLPFVMVCFVSAVLAERSDWAGYEVVRVAKVALILFYCRYNIGPKEWWVCVAALGLSVLVQSTFGVLQVVGLLGSYQLEAWDISRRANGTLAHASILSGYMLLLAPLFLSLAVTLRRIELKAICALVGLMGFVGLGFTLSRIPWILAILGIVGLTIALLRLRIILLKRAIAVWSLFVIVAGLTLLPFVEQIRGRFTSDLSTAISWRLAMNEKGIELFKEKPFFGIGLANFPLYLRSSNMEFADSLDLALGGVFKRAGAEEQTIKGFHWMWVPHNLYILLLAEIGLLGLGTFLVYLGAALRIAIRALRLPNETLRSAALGLLVGICGVLAQMLTDWAMWLDPILFNFALVVSLLNNAPSLVSAAPLSQAGSEDQLAGVATIGA